MNSKKLLTSAVALGTAAVLALGGTFAWQSISQTALNERSDIVNPGGRLHNDITFTEGDVMTTNNDIYVENFADEDIFARVRLSEYMEIVMNYGNPDAEVVETVAGTKTPREDSSYTADNATRQDEFDYTYDVHYYDQDNATDEYWDWTMGSDESDELYYMPTFNLNKDSLVADLNGNYTVTVGGIANYEDNYEGYTVYDADSTESGTEIYDADTNKLDEVGTDFENLDQYVTDGNIKTIADVEHTAARVGTTNGFISMEAWLALKDAGEETSNYWVYDTDGWVYWSSPIKADEATGLLLDSFTLRQVMDDTYYYAINVVGQFVTANDVGKANSTGFYADGETVSEDAETLLKEIGVQFADDTTDDEETSDITIHKDDTAAVTYSRRASGEYALVAEGFGENVTYTVTGAQRCKVTADNKLIVNKWESASSFTVTAADEDGNTGTVTITPTGTTPTDNPIFELYKVTDSGNEYMQRLTDDAVTLNVKTGEKYHISVDFAARDDIEYLFELDNAGTYDFVDTDEIAFRKVYGKDHVARVYTDIERDGYFYSGIFEMNIEIYEAAAGKSYELGGGGSNDDGISGSLDITFIVAADDTDNDTTTHTLTIEDVIGDARSVYDVTDDGNVIVVIDPTYDATDDDETNLWKIGEQVTAYAQKKGSANVFSRVVKAGKELTCVYPESNDKWNIFVDLIDEGVTFDNKALTEYDIWLSVADDDGSITTSNKLTYEFWSQTVSLTESGATDSMSTEYGTFLAVDGMTMTDVMNGYMTTNSFVSNITVKKDNEDVVLESYSTTSDTNRYNGNVDDAEVLKLEIRYSKEENGEDSEQADCIVFEPKAAGSYEFTFTINGTPYTATITVTE